MHHEECSTYNTLLHDMDKQELTRHGGYNPTPMTIEEKVANAVFYVADGITYTIEYTNIAEGHFTVSSLDDQSGDIEIKIDSIPADAYFLGTVRL